MDGGDSETATDTEEPGASSGTEGELDDGDPVRADASEPSQDGHSTESTAEDEGSVTAAPTAMAPGGDGGTHPAAGSAGTESGAGGAVSAGADQDLEGAPDDGPAQEHREDGDDEPPEDVQQYERFTKVDGSRYERVNDFLRDRTHITAREWAIARLCADFRTETGVEMTKIGENLPDLVPFMTDTYTPQAVNQARASFEEKVRMAGATFLYGAMCDFFTAEELDDVIYEATETAKFLLEVEGVDLAVEEELAAEDRISDVMREVRAASEALRNGPVECPDCGHEFGAEELE